MIYFRKKKLDEEGSNHLKESHYILEPTLARQNTFALMSATLILYYMFKEKDFK